MMQELWDVAYDGNCGMWDVAYDGKVGCSL